MSDDHSNEGPRPDTRPEGQQQKASEAEWNPDRFPTSARPIFRSYAVLAFIIIVLCGVVYYSSDHSDPEAEKQLEEKRSELLNEEGEF